MRSATCPSSKTPRTCSSSSSPARYEHASLILTSNLPFARWGDVFGDQTVAADMIDRILHHADVHTLKGSSYRLKHVTRRHPPSVRLSDQTNQKVQHVA